MNPVLRHFKMASKSQEMRLLWVQFSGDRHSIANHGSVAARDNLAPKTASNGVRGNGGTYTYRGTCRVLQPLNSLGGPTCQPL